MSINTLKHELYKLYNDLVKTDDVIREWLEIEFRVKWAFSYEYSGGYYYGNMMTNLSKVFNYVLNNVYDLVVTVIVHMILYRCNKYFVNWRATNGEFF
jgi:hypothetical protein